MIKPDKHLFLCGSFRVSGEPQGVCYKKGALNMIQYIESELVERGMKDAAVSITGCLKACDRGPIMVIYPDNYWYGGVESEDVVDEILDALEEGREAEKYILK
ncbi:MAG: (2Fe-2S) ferredoxin domain-containing protein [Spirochaetes bacterium]|nr:(2Fe-2S) ferredoxin domain-containing protein [Spirochaetota bacterium]